MAYFKIDAQTVRTGADKADEELEEDEGGEGVTAARPNLVASFAARDAMGLRIEDAVPVAVDVAHLHLFDADTGAPLR